MNEYGGRDIENRDNGSNGYGQKTRIVDGIQMLFRWGVGRYGQNMGKGGWDSGLIGFRDNG